MYKKLYEDDRIYKNILFRKSKMDSGKKKKASS